MVDTKASHKRVCVRSTRVYRVACSTSLGIVVLRITFAVSDFSLVEKWREIFSCRKILHKDFQDENRQLTVSEKRGDVIWCVNHSFPLHCLGLKRKYGTLNYLQNGACIIATTAVVPPTCTHLNVVMRTYAIFDDMELQQLPPLQVGEGLRSPN